MPKQGNHIGTLIKPHGFRGALVLTGKVALIENLNEGIPLFIEISGQRIPFFIEELIVDPSGKRSIIKFEFIDSDKEARRYIACDLYDDEKLGKTKPRTDLEQYIGYSVIDNNTGNRFRVVDVVMSAENPLFILEPDTKESKTQNILSENLEIMLPANADYIHEINSKQKLIYTSFPEGLIF